MEQNVKYVMALILKKYLSWMELKSPFLEKQIGSVLVLNLLAQAFKEYFARTKGKKLARPA